MIKKIIANASPSQLCPPLPSRMDADGPACSYETRRASSYNRDEFVTEGGSVLVKSYQFHCL